MSEQNDPTAGLTRWTPEVAAEVKRNQILWLVVTVAAVVGFCLVFALLVDPNFSGAGGAIGMRMITFMVALLAPCIALILALVHLFDCWPAALRSRFLQERFAVSAQDVAQARRGAIDSSGYWLAVLRGVIVSWAFVSLGMLTWWLFSGKWGLGFPSAMIVIVAAQISGQAWTIRKLVGEKGPIAR